MRPKVDDAASPLRRTLETAGRTTLDRFGGLVGIGDGKDARAQRALKALETNGVRHE